MEHYCYPTVAAGRPHNLVARWTCPTCDAVWEPTHEDWTSDRDGKLICGCGWAKL